MRLSSTIPAQKQIGIGLALVMSVGFVSFVFSFLGTILAGALVGMMAGSNPRWRWQFLPVSLVFPGVMIATLHVTRTELTWRENAGLPLVCLGVFWVTFVMTRALLRLEARQASPGSPSAAAASPKPAGAASERTPVLRAYDVSAAGPGLEELDGTWLRETTAPDGKPCRKIIEVAHRQVALSLVDRAGKVRFLAKGDLAVEQLGAFKTVKVSHCETDPSGFCAEKLGLPGKWLYRIVDDKLTVAVDFEETAPGRQPLVETYVRSRER